MQDNSYSKSSMVYWYPKIKHLDIPQPKTEIVRIPFEKFMELINGDSTLNEYAEKFSSIMDSLQPFPIFLRTDHSSQKHSFKKTCRLPDKSSLFGHVLELIDSNMASDLEDNALVFRKWLDLDAGFSAFNGLPINTEARVFIKSGVVQCIHPYWSEDPIESWLKSNKLHGPTSNTNTYHNIDPNWKKILKSQNDIVDKSHGILKKYAEMIIGSIGDDYWSVDFALGRDNKWYLIDMAPGNLSWHHNDCDFSNNPVC